MSAGVVKVGKYFNIAYLNQLLNTAAAKHLNPINTTYLIKSTRNQNKFII